MTNHNNIKEDVMNKPKTQLQILKEQQARETPVDRGPNEQARQERFLQNTRSLRSGRKTR